MKNINKISITLILLVLVSCIFLYVITNKASPENESSNTATIAPIIKEKSKPKLSPEETEKVIKAVAQEVTSALFTADMEKLHTYIHPEKGVRFSQYGIVDLDSDLVFDASQIKNFFNDETIYNWGVYDGSGEPIERTPKEYFDRFINIGDFSKAKIGYNEILTDNGYPENQFQVYKDAIIVEYYFPGIKYQQDWKSLRIVFDLFKGNYYIIGIISNEWTI